MEVNVRKGMRGDFLELNLLQQAGVYAMSRLLSGYAAGNGIIIGRGTSGLDSDFSMSRTGNYVTVQAGFAVVQMNGRYDVAYLPQTVLDVSVPQAGLIVLRPYMDIHPDGTVSLENGSPVVMGDGTTFTLIARGGNLLIIDSSSQGNNNRYLIQSVSDDGTLTLFEPFAGVNETGLSFAIGADYVQGWAPVDNSDYSLLKFIKLGVYAVAQAQAGDIVIGSYDTESVVDSRMQALATWKSPVTSADSVQDGALNGITSLSERGTARRVESLLGILVNAGVVMNSDAKQLLVQLNSSKQLTINAGYFVDDAGRIFYNPSVYTMNLPVVEGDYWVIAYGNPTDTTAEFDVIAQSSNGNAPDGSVILAGFSTPDIIATATIKDMRQMVRVQVRGGLAFGNGYPQTSVSSDGTVLGDWTIGEFRMSEDFSHLAFVDGTNRLKTLATTDEVITSVSLNKSSGLQFADGSVGEKEGDVGIAVKIDVAGALKMTPSGVGVDATVDGGIVADEKGARIDPTLYPKILALPDYDYVIALPLTSGSSPDYVLNNGVVEQKPSVQVTWGADGHIRLLFDSTVLDSTKDVVMPVAMSDGVPMLATVNTPVFTASGTPNNAVDFQTSNYSTGVQVWMEVKIWKQG